MDSGQIAILIMQILTLLTSIIAPLVSSFAYLLKHISESSCCGGGIKVRASSNNLNVEAKKEMLQSNEVRLMAQKRENNI
jgi:hypothetical protein